MANIKKLRLNQGFSDSNINLVCENYSHNLFTVDKVSGATCLLTGAFIIVGSQC